VTDVNYATRWLKAHARDFNADADCIGGLGTSSGGHALFLSAMRPNDPRYRTLPLPEGEDVSARLSYLLAAWPVLDPYARYLFAKENNRASLVEATNSYFLTHDAMKEGNPLLALERGEPVDLPPALIIQGTADNNVPLSALHRFIEVYRAAGGAVDIEWFPDMHHGFAYNYGAEPDRALEIMKAFVCRQLTGSKPAVWRRLVPILSCWRLIIKMCEDLDLQAQSKKKIRAELLEKYLRKRLNGLAMLAR
jgi:acetyl esterase